MDHKTLKNAMKSATKNATKDSESGTKKSAAVAHVLEKLRAVHGGIGALDLGDPLDLVMFAQILAHSPLVDAIKTFHAFKTQFVDWNDVRVSNAEEVGDALAGANDPIALAILLKEFLNRLFNERNYVSLDFLRDMTLQEARAFFKKSPGISDVALQFLWATLKEQPVFPIDASMTPMATRLGLVHKERTTHLQQQKELFEKIPKDKMVDAYALLLEHARRTCVPDEEKLGCPSCDVKRSCPYPNKVGSKPRRRA